jgi:hypothetical protein
VAQRSEARYTITRFRRDFPDDASCLEWLRGHLYPEGILCRNCGEKTKHHRLRARRSYSCDRCGRQVYPAAGTIFERSRTPLRVWFHAVYLVASRPQGISAKQLQKEIAVTYKTAWRMLRQIRHLLGAGGGKRSPHSKSRTERTARVGRGRGRRREPASRAGALARPVEGPRRSASWDRWKSRIRAVYHSVSRKYRRTYLDEFAFRHDHRRHRKRIFVIVLRRIWSER